MRSSHALLLSALLLATALAGCTGGPPRAEVEFEDGFPRFNVESGLYEFRWTHDDLGPFHVAYAPGALSTITNEDDALVEVNLTDGEGAHRSLLVTGTGEAQRFGLAKPFELAPGQTARFLAPPSADPLFVLVEDTAAVLHPRASDNYQPTDRQIISGENVIELMAHQEATFPHREPGVPNYWKSIEYFQGFFEDLGYQVEVDPYGTHDATLDGLACLPARGTTTCPESLANVVAIKPGTDPDAGILFVAGGHFDMVNGTTHAAFDDTSGTIGTLELARAMAPYEFEHTLMFGLWGGEENGLLGSQFWVRTHPQEVAQIESYWNLDVIGMSWPAPLTEPDPLVIAAGPDVPSDQSGGSGDPVSTSLHTWARTLQNGWFGFPDEVNGTDVFHYEGVTSGQATGYAGVNAQSDHTPFIAAGVPSYFIFNGDALDMPVQLHTESDTLINMTKYSLFGVEANIEDPTWPSDEIRAQAEDALARSFETVLYFPFYHAVLVDLGLYTPPAAGNASPPGGR